MLKTTLKIIAFLLGLTLLFFASVYVIIIIEPLLDSFFGNETSYFIQAILMTSVMAIYMFIAGRFL
jgi:hypothetical protein